MSARFTFAFILLSTSLMAPHVQAANFGAGSLTFEEDDAPTVASPVAVRRAPLQQGQPVSRPVSEPRATGNEVVDLVNRFRAQNGLWPVHLDSTLSDQAQYSANLMFQLDQRRNIDHDPNWKARMWSLSGSHFAENIAWNSMGAKAVVELWISSPGHRANMLQPWATKIGVGQTGAYWANEFSD